MKTSYKSGQIVFLKRYPGMNYFKPWFENGEWNIHFSDKKSSNRDLEIIVGADKIHLPDKSNGNKMYFEMDNGDAISVKKRTAKKPYENDYFKGSRYIIASSKGYFCVMVDSKNDFDKLFGVKYIKLSVDNEGPKINLFSEIPKTTKVKVNRFSSIPFGTNSFIFDDIYAKNGVKTEIYNFNKQLIAEKKLYALKR